MRAPSKGVRFRGFPIVPCRGVFLYLLLLLLALVFTQAFRSPISAMVLIFVLLLPAADLLCLLISWFFLSVTVEGTNRVIVRGDRLSVPICLTNHGLLPLPCVEAVLSVPRPYALHTQTVTVRASLPPFATAITGADVGFACRGFFVVGAEDVYLYDYLRLLRVRKRVRRHVSIRVLPKCLPSADCLPPFHDGGIGASEAAEGQRMNEYGDIREYRPGDGIKSIHWKLSTKWEELQVRKPVSERHQALWILTDYGADSEAFSFSDHYEAVLRNRLAEECLTAALDAARLGASGRAVWLQPDGSPVTYAFSDISSAEQLSFPLSEAEGGTGCFPQALFGEEGASVLYLLAFLSTAQEDTVRRTAADCAGSPFSVLLLSLADLVAPEEREAYEQALEILQNRLTEDGIPVTVSFRKEASP